MKRKQKPDRELFQRTARARAHTPRAANRLPEDAKLTPSTDRTAVRERLAAKFGNDMPETATFDALCDSLDPLCREFHDARHKPADAFYEALRAAFAIGQEQLAALEPITGTTYTPRGRRWIARPHWSNSPEAKVRYAELLELDSMIPPDPPRSWTDVDLPLTTAIDTMLHAMGRHSRALCNEIKTALIPLISGEGPSLDSVRTASERTNKRG